MRLPRRVQFSIRSLLLASVAIAILAVAGLHLRYRYLQLPFHPCMHVGMQMEVAAAVEGLNRQLVTYALPAHLKLTDREIIDAVNGQKELAMRYANGGNKILQLCDDITLNGKLPAGSTLEMARCGTVTLDVPFDATSGYGFIIRHPGLNRNAAGNFTMDWEWKPKAGQTCVWTGSNWQVQENN
jgi:hypothetical protein